MKSVPSLATAGEGWSLASVKAAVRGGTDQRSAPKGLLILVADLGVYVALLAGILVLPVGYAALCSLALGLSIALLFIIAHDACHGSFTPVPWLNTLIARVCFLPSLFPLSPWEYGHNQVHHGWTNLREKDYVWRPLSLDDYRRLPAWRRLLERSYRSLPGVALYSIVEIWWKRMIVLGKAERRRLSRVERRVDRALVCTYGCALVGFTASFGVSAVILAVLVPWLVFHWLFATVTLLHHTHPRARWCKTQAEWSFLAAQVRNTVHLRFPKLVDRLLHNITVHGAHHVDPKVPLYALPAAQTRLLESVGDEVIEHEWSLRSQLEVLRTCRLYDYDKHLWMDFDGRPTTEETQVPALGLPNRPADESANLKPLGFVGAPESPTSFG